MKLKDWSKSWPVRSSTTLNWPEVLISNAVGCIKKRLRFKILKTTVISFCGDRGARKNMVDIDNFDLNLEPQGQR